ncbi:MAG TPA: hypothetical protein VMK12_23250 [Anaeromyxobacteraceae bacterium]|nr:hypothetical protein [Anaeromyxobacteraceae bacterium]
MNALPFSLPPLESVLLCRRADALAALGRAGWQPYATPITFDAERLRLFNIDLTEPDVAFYAGDDLEAVAHVESDHAGRVALFEITGSSPVAPETVAAALLPRPGPPRLSGGPEARQWVWGPETGGAGTVHGKPVRLWICAEKAYGDRLWAVASVVIRG